MMKGVAAFCCLLIVTACDRLQDPVSATIFTAPENASVDVKRSLPVSADEALRVLASWGYQPDSGLEARANTKQVSVEGPHSISDIYFLPDVVRPENARDRKHLMRIFKIDYGTEGYGLVLDVDANGHVVTAVGFVSYRVVF